MDSMPWSSSHSARSGWSEGPWPQIELGSRWRWMTFGAFVTSELVEYEPHRRLAWNTTTSGACWLFELEAAGSGTRLVQHRALTKQLTKLSTVFATALLGGVSGHADELEEGMAETLHRIKHIAENS